QPFHPPSSDAYHQLKDAGVLREDKAIILDSGCGTGKSTQNLANVFPRHIVIGIDQSNVRLARSGVKSGFSKSGNCVLLRAELSTFWRLLLNDGYSPERHYLLYPNPWPKPGHLKRRWHGHPVFPQLLCLGGEIEMRCNWEIYALEFARAVNLATGGDIRPNRFYPDIGISPFEQKYFERGQALFSVTVPARET
ncbi:MAG: SAM-dependent methyltransferase, partial [Gammaproteobacteria bacterium]|nr:SAM-dependent methyltransferase [Gammaproteobacteria bacterium]